jgi:DMSO/TMAO reductase YedYZ molybdopterin-dependent catalytic subunit
VCLILTSFTSSIFTVRASSNDSIWQLSVSGLVNNPSTFTLTDLEAMPQTTVSAKLYCVDFPTTVVTAGNWVGVKLSTLIDEAGGIQPGAIKVAFHANDGYSTDLTIDAAKSDNIILAYAKDNSSLSEVLRLVVPEHWGYKWIAQVVSIEIVNYNFTGKWETLGYSDNGNISDPSRPQNSYTQSPIQIPRTTSTPSVSPKQTPTPSILPTVSPPPSASNLTFQEPQAQTENTSSQNISLLIAIAATSIIVIVVIALVTSIIKKKN